MILDEDNTLLPPDMIKGQAGRPNNVLRVRKRIQSNGEFHSSSRFNAHILPGVGVPTTAQTQPEKRVCAATQPINTPNLTQSSDTAGMS